MAGKFQLGSRSHVATNRGLPGSADNQKRSPREQKEFFMLSKFSQFSQFHVGGLTARAAMALAALAAVSSVGTATANTTYTYTPTTNTAPGDQWSAGTNWSATPVSNKLTTLTFVGSNSTVQPNSLNNTNTDNNSSAFLAQILNLQGTGPASGASTINIAASSGSYLELVNNATGAGQAAYDPTINLNANAGTAGLTYNISAPITLASTGSYDAAFVKGSGTATFNFTGGITTSGTTNVIMQNSNTVNLSGATSNIYQLSYGGTVNDSANLNVGSLNTGISTASFIQSGGTVTEGTATAGTTVDGSNIRGSYILNSGTFNAYIASGNALTLGYRGTPMANFIINGGALTVETGTGLSSQWNISVNFNGTSNATVTQNAGTVTVSAIAINYVSNSTLTDQGNGLYHLNGGTLITGQIVGQAGSGVYGTSTFDFNGGTLEASATNGGFMQGFTTVNVQAGGAIINTNTFNDTITTNLLSDPTVVGGTDGGLTKDGLGTLTLSGTGNTYNGNTTVNDGTLQIDSHFLASTSTVSIASSALMNLDYTGTDYITALYLNGVSQAAGVYSHTSDPIYFGNFAGTLTVTGSNVPEPAALGLMALGGLGILFLGKRRRG